jgi:hypothetical protein
MNPFPKLLTFLCAVALGFGGVAHAGAAGVEEEKAETLTMMRRVGEALMAYKNDNGRYPDELSDLVPRFLPDAAALISPTEKRTGRHGDNGHIDPKFRTSFCYEFTSRKFNRSALSFRELKERQMEEFGPVVPLLRCFLYERVVNLSVSGDIFESALYWEVAPDAQAVMARVGLGPGFKDGEFAKLTVTDNKTGKAVAGAEVRITARQYHGLPLPDRTLRTGEDGTVPVPLAPPDGKRKLTVTVLKPGYYAPPQKWEDGKLPKEASLGLDEGAVLGGIVRTTDGKPLKGAEVTVLHMRPDEKKESKFIETPLAQETTDAGGRWTCDHVPRDFVGIALEVKHEAAWTSWFYSSRETGPHKVLRSALLATSAELFVDPAAMVRGTVRDAAGKPMAGVDVLVAAAYRVPPHVPKSEDAAPIIRQPPAPVKTDAAGRYSLPWREDAQLMIMAFPPGVAPMQVKADAAPDMKELDLRVTGGRGIMGRVTDEAGKALGGAEIVFTFWDGFVVPGRRAVAKTDDFGNVIWQHAPLEAVRISIYADGYYAVSRKIDEAAGGTPALDIKLRKRD